jgi:hypothetical protein
LGDELSARVECHSGSGYAERPLALHFEGKRLEIEAVVAQWRAPSERFFVVRTAGGRRFEVIYNEAQDAWRMKEI